MKQNGYATKMQPLSGIANESREMFECKRPIKYSEGSRNN